MAYITIRFVEVGTDLKEEGKVYFEDDLVKYEIQTEEGVQIPKDKLIDIAYGLIEKLRGMSGPVLEVRVEI